MRKALKFTTLAAMGGALLQFGGCFNAVLSGLLVQTGLEFFTDNDGIFDLFEDP